MEAAIRLLCHRKPPDFVKKLINLAPSLVSLDENLRHTLVDSLAAMAQTNEGVAPELVAATKSPTAIQRKHSLGRKLETVAPRHRRVYEITRTGHEVWHADANARSCEGLKDGRASRSCDHRPVHPKLDSPTQCGYEDRASNPSLLCSVPRLIPCFVSFASCWVLSCYEFAGR